MREALGDGESAETDDAVQLGSFGDYDLLEELGHGGMGVVYKARQCSLHRVVALKMLLGGQFAGKVALGRFRAEAELAAQLQHPNIVAIHEIGEQDGLPYFTMDFVPGHSLVDLVRDHPLPARAAAGYVQTIARAIHYAHEQGVLHRDLKPSNILIDAFDQPRITDFGLAKRLTGSTSDLTVSGQALGSPNFMPPEQAAGKHKTSGPTSDIYGLGAILYYLITGRPPFMAENVSAAVRQVLENEPVSPRVLNPGVPRDLETLCLKCLQKEAKQRYASAAEVADELERFLRGEPILARPVSTITHLWRWCRRKPALATLAMVVTALAVISTMTVARMKLAQAGREQERYRANIQLAAAHIEKGDVVEALESLLQCPPHLRHWEWGHLVGECHREVLALDHARDPLTNSVIQLKPPEWKCGFSADGRRVGTVHPSGIVQVWELPSGRPLWSLRATNEIQAGILWLPAWSGVVLARGNTVELVPIASSAPRLQLEGHLHAVRRLAVSLDGQRIAALAADDTMRIWDATSGQPLAQFPVIAGGQRVFFTGDGRLVVAAADQAVAYDTVRGTVLVRMSVAAQDALAVLPDSAADRFVSIAVGSRFIGHRYRLMTTNGLVRDLGEIPQRHYQEAAFSPDRRAFWTSGIEATAAVYDARTGEVIMTLPTRVNHGCFSPDGGRLATRGGTSTIHIWDLASRRELLKLQGHREAVHDLAFSPDGRLLASVSANGGVKVWSAQPGREISDQVGLPWGISFTSDGRRFAYAHLPDWITVRDTQSGRQVVRLRRLHRMCLALALRPDGRQLATSDGFGETAIWDVETGRLLRVLRRHNHGIDRVLYSRDGHRLITGGYDGTVRIWDPESGQELGVLARVPKLVESLDLSPDGRHIVVADNYVARIWSAESGQLERSLPGGSGYVYCTLFSPDGIRVASSGDDRALRIWNVHTGQILDSWKLRGIGTTFDFSPDGRRVALRTTQAATYATDAPTLEIWNVETGHQLLAFRGFIEMGNIAGFSPDGRRIVTDWWDSKLRQWEAFPWTEAEYPGSAAQPLRERMRLYADQYWRERLAAEREADDTNATLTVELPFDRSMLPVRDPATPPHLIDLTAHYTGVLNECSYLDPVSDYMGIDLRNAPNGLVHFQDVPFDMRGLIQLAQASRDVLWWDYPRAVEQIKLRQRVRTLHAIMGSVGRAPEGKAIGALVLHYADGTRQECEILYGRHVRHWWTHADTRTDTDLAQVAWEGPHAFPKIHPTRLRIFHSSWENPHPDKPVVSLDFVSRMTTTAAPFLIAVTVE
ncbi:MAG: protein kinase [Verrucomicrobia bacterium]|nr:protein kinase [Verrucomicrobiota bacterium]